ncbi:CocE/NonD family hydrolase [Roseisalinus antarcticus]|uniref:Cocaine esterase n=1 Tax=Roseisalinus antarcticus TaxID=254357 RepID=A0A1Y5T0M0_9RHOB|nr:CocE/NonD family hydrolase [Roseisalinus antarcticus]SLN49348.1 Cocaine esterase [Roseisalinus antarcticus]
MTGTFTIRDHVPVPMRDGIDLHADVWLPEGAGPFPVLLQRTPYIKEEPFGTQHISAMDFRGTLRRGYAIVVQDCRGRWSSDGQFDPFCNETADGHDTIAWLCAQPFCDGRIAMFGASYVGATQVLASLGAPEGLAAIAPNLTTARHDETWTSRGGAVELGFLYLWIIEALAGIDLQKRAGDMTPGALARARALLADLSADPDAAFRRLPLIDEGLVGLAPYVADWFETATAETTRLTELAETPVPALVIGGWNDIFVEGSIELFETLRGRWPTRAEVPDRLILGPWSHGNPSDFQGDLWHGYGSTTAPLLAEHLAFFEAAFAGACPDTPMVRYFRSGSNTWHAAPDWPLPGTAPREMFLDGAGGLSAAPGPDAALRYTADPSDPVPTTGGATFLPGLVMGKNSGPRDQAEVERRGDVLVLTSAPLEAAMEVTGRVEAVLWVATTAPCCDWTVRLCEVDATGASRGLVDGILRWDAPDGAAPAVVRVTLGHIGHLFAQGSRVRVQVASSNFPRFDRNPQSGAAPATATEADFRPAAQTVLVGAAHPSRIVLPVIPEAFPGGPEFTAL